MQQRPLVYVSRITNLSDARYCAGMGVDLLGFVIDPSDPDYVSPETYQQLIGWVAGPERVVEVGLATFDESVLREHYAPQYIHITANRLKDWPQSSAKLIVETPYAWLSELGTQRSGRQDIAFILVPDLDHPVPSNVVTSIPLLTGIRPIQGPARMLLEHTGAAGIALQGSRETAPGLKDYDHLSQVLEELNG